MDQRNLTVQFAFILALVCLVNLAVICSEKQCQSSTIGEFDVNKARSNKSNDVLDEYYQNRRDFIDSEVEFSFGSDIILNEKENLANKIVMKAKEDELQIGFQDSHRFTPSRHIFEVLDVIKESKLFRIIQKMPKGGILHIHEMAMCSPDYLVQLTYWPNLWQRTSNGSDTVEEFQFAREQPKANKNDTIWRLVNDARTAMGASNYDESLRKRFTLYDPDVNPRVQFNDLDEVWKRFEEIFTLSYSLLVYKPVRKEYFKGTLEAMLEDGVQYLEIRGGLLKVFIFI